MRERGIDPAAVRGTGPNGRIIEADVLLAGTMPSQTSNRTAAAGAMRRAVAAKVSESFATVPHFYLRSEADVATLVQMREQTLEAFEQRCGQRPSLTDFILRAMVLVLRDCPQANRIWQHNAIVELPGIAVGLVVQVGDGLLAPVLHDADRLSLMDLIRQRAALVAAVRSGKTPAQMLQGAAISLSNLGRHRVDEFTPIISPPQSSMLAVGRAAQRPMEHKGQVCLRRTMHLTLAVDHRVMDGVPAVEFFDRIVELLEKPFPLFCDTSSTDPRGFP